MMVIYTLIRADTKPSFLTMVSESKTYDEMMVIYRLIRADTKPSFLTMGSESKR